jgi:hypothetical protein
MAAHGWMPIEPKSLVADTGEEVAENLIAAQVRSSHYNRRPRRLVRLKTDLERASDGSHLRGTIKRRTNLVLAKRSAEILEPSENLRQML